MTSQARPVWSFAKGQAAQNEMRNGTVRESQKHAQEKTYKRSSVKPCFKTVIFCTQNLINAALEYLSNHKMFFFSFCMDW